MGMYSGSVQRRRTVHPHNPCILINLLVNVMHALELFLLLECLKNASERCCTGRMKFIKKNNGIGIQSEHDGCLYHTNCVRLLESLYCGKSKNNGTNTLKKIQTIEVVIAANKALTGCSQDLIILYCMA